MTFARLFSCMLGSYTIGIFAVTLCLVGCGGASSDAKKEARIGVDDAKPQQPQAGRVVDVKKIIYEGSVEAIVDDIDPVADKVRQLTLQYEGYIASSEIDRTYGTHRSAKFTIRVPAAKYETLREEFAKLGTTTKNGSKSDDVTDEFSDLEARIRILKKEEQALEELLTKSAGKLEDVIKVRETLTYNREQIEKGEGRLKLLTSKVSYSTIVLNLRETKDYIPPTAPTFSNQLDKTFSNSLQTLYGFGKDCLLFIVGIAPWSPLILLGLWLSRRAIRYARRNWG